MRLILVMLIQAILSPEKLTTEHPAQPSRNKYRITKVRKYENTKEEH